MLLLAWPRFSIYCIIGKFQTDAASIFYAVVQPLRSVGERPKLSNMVVESTLGHHIRRSLFADVEEEEHVWESCGDEDNRFRQVPHISQGMSHYQSDQFASSATASHPSATPKNCFGQSSFSTRKKKRIGDNAGGNIYPNNVICSYFPKYFLSLQNWIDFFGLLNIVLSGILRWFEEDNFTLKETRIMLSSTGSMLLWIGMLQLISVTSIQQR